MDRIKSYMSTRMPSRLNSLHSLTQATQQSNGAGSQPFSSQYSLFSSQQRNAQNGGDWSVPSQNPSFPSTPTQTSQHTGHSQSFANLLRTPIRVTQRLVQAFGSRRTLPEPEVAAPSSFQQKSQKSAEETSGHVFNEILNIKSTAEKLARNTDEMKKQLSSGLCVAELRVGSVPLPEFLKSSMQKACQTSHDASVRILSTLSDVTNAVKLLCKHTEKTREELTTSQSALTAKFEEVDVTSELRIVNKRLESIRKSLKKRQKKKRLVPCPNPYSAFGYRNLFPWKPRKATKSESVRREIGDQKSPVNPRVHVVNDGRGGEKKERDAVKKTKRRLSVLEESASKRGKVGDPENDEELTVVYESASTATQGPVTRNSIRQQSQQIDKTTEQAAVSGVTVSKKGDNQQVVSPPNVAL